MPMTSTTPMTADPPLRPTNVLFICSDEHSPRVLGGYGNAVVRTPNLDALAARGTRFASAYTPFSICVPARACLATGRYAHRLGIWDNGAPYTGREAPSWGPRLTAQGHEVTTIGKLHPGLRHRVEPPGAVAQRRAPHQVVQVLVGEAVSPFQVRREVPRPPAPPPAHRTSTGPDPTCHPPP